MPLAEADDGQHRASRNTVPVVITNADMAAGLGLARALRDLRVPIYGLASDPRSPFCRSSAWHQVSLLSDESEQGWLDALLELSARHPRQVLFPVQDDVVDVVSRHREVLGEHYLFVLPDRATVELLADKTVFARWAQANGFPVPRAHVVTSPAELDAVLDAATFPVVLKPAVRSRRWFDAEGRKEHYRLDSRAAVDRAPFRYFDVCDRYVVQEWIEGNDSDVHFCLVYRDRSGRELAHQTGRKLVQWPVGTGDTAICTTTEDPDLHRLTQQVFDRAGLAGVASLEVKRDRRDGRCYITEPTVGRVDLQSSLAVAAGQNIPVVAYRDACGLPPDEATSSTRRDAIWVHESHLPSALVVAALRRQLDLVEIARAVVRCRALSFAHGGAGDLRPLTALIARKTRAVARLLRRRRAAAV